LPLKTLATRVVFAGIAPAVATPVAKRLNQHLQSRLIGKNGAAFSGCNVVRRIKAQSGNIAKRADLSSFVGRTERIAAVFDQPEIMFPGKGSNCVEIEDVPQRMARNTAFVRSLRAASSWRTSISYSGTVTSRKTGRRRF